MNTVLFTLLVALCPAAQDIERGPMVAHYSITATDAAGVDGVIPLDVELRVTHPPRPRVVFEIPVWTPGSYRLRDFPERISQLRAVSAGGRELEVEKLHRGRWQVRHGDATEVRLRYRVELRDGDRFMMRGSQRRCVTYEGPAVYLYVRDHLDVPCHVQFDLPDGWAVGSGLVDCRDGSYFARDYDFLADCPVKLGVFQKFSFRSHERPIDVIVDGPGDIEFDQEAWLANLEKITDCEGEIFGGFPFDRYTFLFTASPRGGGGGLEHLTSTAIGVPARSLRNSAAAGMSVVAHEFFHLWNVKRLRPRELGPFDYTRPNRTTALWFCEGITSYYGAVALARCGLRTPESFWSQIRREISSLENNPARAHVSSAMASYGVWDPPSSGRQLNYYNSGTVIGLLLDLEIRTRTQNRRSLDDVMRALYHLCQARGRGFDEGDVAAAVAGVTGDDFDEWFDRYVFGTEVPPYAQILAAAGIDYSEERRTEVVVRGIGRGRNGVYYSGAGSSARRAGWVRAAGGTEVADWAAWEAVLSDLTPGVPVRLEIERFTGGDRVVDAVAEEVARVAVHLAVSETASASARAIRDGIVSGVPGRPGK